MTNKVYKLQYLKVNSVLGLIGKKTLMVASVMLFATVPAYAQYGGGGSGASSAQSSKSANKASTAFSSYVDVMINSEKTDDDPQLDTAHGISVLGGFRRKGWYGFEFGLGYLKDGVVDKQNIQFNTLIYPFSSLPNFYTKVATGITRYVDYPFERGVNPIPDSEHDFVTINYGGGMGYVLPIKISDTKFSIRAEAVYQVGDRFLERESDFEEDISAPGTFHDVQFNLGIRFPL